MEAHTKIIPVPKLNTVAHLCNPSTWKFKTILC